MRVALLVGLIALLLVGLSFRALRQERSELAEQFATSSAARLREQVVLLDAEMQKAQRQIERALTSGDDWRAAARNEPLLRQAFVLSKEGALTFPITIDATEGERQFLTRTSDIWSGHAVLRSERTEEDSSAIKRGQGDTLARLATRARDGWLTWYFDDGMQLLYWHKLGDGRIAGAWVERIALQARLVSALTQTDGRLIIRDAEGSVVHQVGQGDTSHAAIAALALPTPFQAWRLEYFAAPAERQTFLSPRMRTGESLAVLTVLVVIAALGLAVVREQRRALRDAAQRVSFVTQVSHELKTPLTNIRLYAELLEDDDRHAAVIAQESRRLSRLIDNVLTFSRPRELHLRAILLDACAGEVAEQFRAGLLQRGMTLQLTLAAERPVRADADAVAQILGNLLSNAEKYAAAGAHVGVATEQDTTHTRLIVSDRGPGIAPSERERIFAPYYRCSAKLTDGVTGTGIGLTIARDLAHKLGGSLQVAPADSGACFVLTLENA